MAYDEMGSAPSTGVGVDLVNWNAADWNAVQAAVLRTIRNISNLAQRHAEDLCQETLLRVWNRRYEFRDLATAVPFARTVARHGAVDLFRKLRREELYGEFDHQVSDGHNVGDQVEQRDLVEKLGLRAGESELLLWDESDAELAGERGATVAAIQKRRSRLKAELRDRVAAVTRPVCRHRRQRARGQGAQIPCATCSGCLRSPA